MVYLNVLYYYKENVENYISGVATVLVQGTNFASVYFSSQSGLQNIPDLDINDLQELTGRFDFDLNDPEIVISNWINLIIFLVIYNWNIYIMSINMKKG